MAPHTADKPLPVNHLDESRHLAPDVGSFSVVDLLDPISRVGMHGNFLFNLVWADGHGWLCAMIDRMGMGIVWPP